MPGRKAFFGLLALLAVAICGDALGHVDPVTKEDYSTWKQPGNGASCCNDYDCAPTQARWNPEKGQWEALFRGRWVLVPNDKVLKHAAKDGNPHLCAQPATGDYGEPIEGPDLIFCFTAPEAKG